jgi:hypothetical protein
MNVIRNLLHKLQSAGGTAKVCATRRISDAFFECKVRKPNPTYCEHSLCSGGSFICNHQDREIFSRK